MYNWRFELLFFSLICVFVLNIIFPSDIYGGRAQGLYLFFQIIAGINLFSSRHKITYRTLLSISLVITAIWILHMFAPIDVSVYMSIIYVLFFGWIMVEVMRQIYEAEIVNRKILLAAICGVVLIGYFGFFVFSAIEVFYPDSFIGLGEGEGRLNSLFYFSYISIMTIGFGDITPVTWIAQNATIFVSLICYIYSLVVVAVIVGRFRPSKKETKKE